MGDRVRIVWRPTTRTVRWRLALFTIPAVATPLSAQDAVPQAGELIRVTLSGAAADRLRVPSPLEATFVMLQGPTVVADTPFSGAVRLPFVDIESLDVQRDRSQTTAIAIGAGAGAVMGIGMWQFLGVLCGAGCDTSDAQTWAPALATAVLVGVFVGAKASSGRRWIPVSLPK